MVGLEDTWTGAGLAEKLPDCVVVGQTPLPFTAPFTPGNTNRAGGNAMLHITSQNDITSKTD